ncbi:MAG: ParB N-terminal domain-containing protein [Deltaproteobacteria bacterium]|nr:ParB N-terminal domain-containing protein [Deltaproteobacteria bacterium]
MIQEIQIGLLVPHPENCNHMEAETREKVKRHIMRTGNYEPVTVRPHPDESGKFQVINGHHRLNVLRELDYERVNCTVWDIDDDQTRLYLATLNRLAGKDIPERRAVLLEKLLGSFDVPDLAELLPDSKKQLKEMSRLVEMELEKLKPFDHLAEIKIDIPVMLSFMMTEPEAATVNEALDLVVSNEGDMNRSKALIGMAAFYLHHQSGRMEIKGETQSFSSESLSN